jgi:hypothetical protein
VRLFLAVISGAFYPFRCARERVHYWMFKWKQARAQKKSQEDDPNVYPLW